jgi:hypothetical protein
MAMTSHFLRRLSCAVSMTGSILLAFAAAADDSLPVIAVEGQPLAANARRLVQALDLLGRPLDEQVAAQLAEAAGDRDAAQLQTILDPHALLVVAINPES